MIAILNEWFTQACPYEEGVAIYLEHGTNAGLKTLLQFGYTHYNERKLHEALDLLYERAIEEEENQIMEQKLAAAGDELDIWKTPEMQALTRERNMLHSQLSALPSQSDRYRVQKRMDKLTDEIEAKAGILPVQDPEEKELPTDRAALHRKLQNIRSNLSKAKKKEQTDALKVKVTRWEAELAEIETLLADE